MLLLETSVNDKSEEKVEFVVSDKFKGTAMMGGLRISACKLSLTW